jgi:periplasmic protein TonB
LKKDTTDTAAQQRLSAFTLEAPPAPDRLPPMLFLAALIHGILIIGVTFNAVLGDEFSEAISLDVTIIADPEKSWVDVEQAEYLAQASQLGAGNTSESIRPSAPLRSDVPIDNAGVEKGDSLDESRQLTDAADQLISTQTEQDIQVADNPRTDPAPDATTPIALEAGVEATMPLPQDQQANLMIKDENPRQLVTSVDTRESKIAVYLDRWKRRIEMVGVKYFPEESVIQGITGSPTLQVTISASGQLEAASIRQSSGSRVLDQAALSILRRASPFDPFPESIRVDYDRLIFAYKWQFAESEIPTTASTM